jgi:hypothetical protein
MHAWSNVCLPAAITNLQLIRQLPRVILAVKHKVFGLDKLLHVGRHEAEPRLLEVLLLTLLRFCTSGW